jgi:5-methylcytosine-specific restriction endonuclease McrA
LSRSYISVDLRKRAAERAVNSCEDCLIPILFGLTTPYHIDHIISEKHGGSTTLENLALSCPTCNFYKGSDISSYLAAFDVGVNLYHPRKDEWSNHFTLTDNGNLVSKSNIATATIKLLHLNDPNQIELRALLIEGEVLVTDSKS